MSTMVVVRVERDTQALLHLAVLEMRASEIKRTGAEMQSYVAVICNCERVHADLRECTLLCSS